MKNTILFAAAISLLTACSSPSPKEKPAATPAPTESPSEDIVQLSDAQIKNSGIQTGTVEKREMHTTLKVNGVVDVPPGNIFSVSLPMGGYIKKMTLIPGMKVSRGAVLATVEDQQYIQLQQDYLTAKSKLKFAEADYIRQKGLNATKATSDKLFQQTESEYTGQKILLSSLAEKLRLIGLNPAALNESNISRSIPVYSPISGFVAKVNVNSGKYVSASEVLFELINPSSLRVNLTVFENDAFKLKEGQKITCSTNKNPDKIYTAVIHLISPNIGDDRTTSVHCDLTGPGKDLLPGTFMNADIQLSNASVTAVPEDAVVKWEGKDYVFTEQGNHKFRLTRVETGTLNNGYIELKTSLSEARLVTKNAYALLMKMKNNGEED